MKNGLVIVESPTKAKTIEHILGKNFLVKATLGHIRDLPEYEFGVNIEKNFTPNYIIIPNKEKIVNQLKKLSMEYEDIYLATDEDREGESIAWHTAIAIGKNPEEVKRVAFHEITPEAIKNAFSSPRKISIDLVNAQQTRRILDRIVGYTLSPLLGDYLEKGLSAGRVQSVALKLIVEREEEIRNFTPKDYWKILAKIKQGNKIFYLELSIIENKKIDLLFFKDEKTTKEIIDKLKEGKLVIKKIIKDEKKLPAPPPFITSTLQQTSSTLLNFSSVKTMFIAQQLYEGIALGKEGNIGLITYMRTDSPNVAKSAQFQAFKYIEQNFGKEYVPDKPPVYKAKLITAQEAHEAIRPTSVFRPPESIKSYLNKDQFQLYSLIWKRFVASQMKNVVVENIKLIAENGIYGFTGESNKIIFDGFSKLWEVKINKGIELVKMYQEGEALNVEEYLSEKHQTKPPSRYTEATLIKTLEKFGIGRPSTYAPTIATLLNRGYVKNKNKNLIPLKIGEIVNGILTKFFPKIINVEFTAKMEEDLDKIANHEKDWIETLKSFYDFFKPMLDNAYSEISKDKNFIISLFKKDKICPKCKEGILMVRKSKYGIFLGCNKYPNCKYTERIT